MGGEVGFDGHLGFPIVALQLNGERLVRFCHLKARMMMDTRKQPAANEDIELRRRVSPGNVDTFAIFALLVPFHRDAVSGILRSEPEWGGQRSWAELFEANETDTSHAHSMNELWPKRAGQETLEDGGINAVIDEETPINGAFEGWNVHGLWSL